MSKLKSKLKYPDRKISDTLLLFAEPLFVGLGPNATEKHLEQALKFAWVTWNAVVHADVAGEPMVLDELRRSWSSDSEGRRCLERMIARKRTLFGDDQRTIGKYELFYKEGELRLRAEARDPTSRQKVD